MPTKDALRLVTAQSSFWSRFSPGPTLQLDGDFDKEIEALYGPRHSDPDKISLRNVTSVEIKKLYGSSASTVDVKDLSTQNIDAWLRDSDCDSQIHTIPLRILIGDQSMRNDKLRPPTSISETHISTSILTEYFHIPTTVHKKLGQEVPYMATHSFLNCHSIVAGTCSAAWCYDGRDKTITAFIVFRVAHSYVYRERMLKILESLRGVVDPARIIPYLILDSTIYRMNSAVTYINDKFASDDFRIIKGTTQQRPFDVLADISCCMEVIRGALKHADVVLDMSEQHFPLQLLHPVPLAQLEQELHHPHHDSLQGLIIIQRNRLQALIVQSESLLQKCKSVLPTIQSLVPAHLYSPPTQSLPPIQSQQTPIAVSTPKPCIQMLSDPPCPLQPRKRVTSNSTLLIIATFSTLLTTYLLVTLATQSSTSTQQPPSSSPSPEPFPNDTDTLFSTMPTISTPLLVLLLLLCITAFLTIATCIQKRKTWRRGIYWAPSDSTTATTDVYHTHARGSYEKLSSLSWPSEKGVRTDEELV